MLRLKLIYAAALVALVCGCAGPQIFQHQLSALDKGLSPAESTTKLGLAPLSTHSSSVAGRAFDFQRYQLNNGLNTDAYFLAYERDRLLFWGYISEFRRQRDGDLGLAFNTILTEISINKR
jgi:hypothetical protein